MKKNDLTENDQAMIDRLKAGTGELTWHECKPWETKRMNRLVELGICTKRFVQSPSGFGQIPVWSLVRTGEQP